jgi:thiamine pyrophosphate-dependent acetolactate synthase large subunit-like protein
VIAWQGFYEWPSVAAGKPSRFYFSSLGCTIPMGIGLALALSHRKIIALVSDGDILMELSSLPSLGKENPDNLLVLVNDNENYQTTGGYPTMTHFETDLAAMAKGAGVNQAFTVTQYDDFKKRVDEAFTPRDSTYFIVMKTSLSSFRTIYETIERAEDKYRFIRYIEETEGIRIFPSPQQDRKLLREAEKKT